MKFVDKMNLVLKLCLLASTLNSAHLAIQLKQESLTIVESIHMGFSETKFHPQTLRIFCSSKMTNRLSY